MKIFLVGGFGFIGKKLIENLIQSHELIIFSRENTRHNEILDKFPSIILEEGNIQEIEIHNSIKRHNPDVVIHLAGLSGLKKCQDNPLEAFTTNSASALDFT